MIYHDTAWVTFLEGEDVSLKLVDVGVGPLDLDPSSGEYRWLGEH